MKLHLIKTEQYCINKSAIAMVKKECNYVNIIFWAGGCQSIYPDLSKTNSSKTEYELVEEIYNKIVGELEGH